MEPKYKKSLTPENLEEVFGGAADFYHRVMRVGETGLDVHMYFIDGLVSGGEISNFVAKPIAIYKNTVAVSQSAAPAQVYNDFLGGKIFNAVAVEQDSLDGCANALVNGFCVLVFDGFFKAIALEVKTSASRGISGPEVENAVKGAKDAFVETIRVNTSLIRRHLRTPDLRIREYITGRRSLTNISVLYIEGITNPALVEQIGRKLEGIDIDGVITASSIEEYLTAPSLFPQLIYTERTDKFCQWLLDGRVGLLADGLPLGYILPATLSALMKTPEDRAQNHIVASALRSLRYLAMIINLILPGLYLAVVTFHPEMIPARLLLSIIRSKHDVPFSTVIEVIGLLLAFELLQEAGLRLPKNIGQTLGIIGGLVVGTAAVEAKIISPVVLIIVSVSGISGYTLPNQDLSNAVRVWRLLIVVAAAVAGLFGLAAMCILMVSRLASLECFGVSYLTPFDEGEALSEIFRKPLRSDKYRDPSARPVNMRNQK